MKSKWHIIITVLLILVTIVVWHYKFRSVEKSPPIAVLQDTKPISSSAVPPVAPPAVVPAEQPVEQKAVDSVGVRGTVTQDGDGQPITKFQIVYLESPPLNGGVWTSILISASTPWRAFDSSTGTFQLDGLPAGKSFALAVKADGFVPTHMSVPALAAGDSKDDIIIRLAPEAGVAGHVVTVQGTPVKGVAIHRGDSEAAKMIARTDAEGRFRILCTGGEILTLCAAHPDFVSIITQVAPKRGQIQTLEIVLKGGGTIAGTVLRGKNPVPSIPVTVYETDRTPKQAMTDAAGRFTLKGLAAGEVEVRAELETDPDSSSLSVQARANITDGAVAQVDLRFPDAAGTISGLITAGGQPVANGFIEAEMVGETGDLFRGARVKPSGEYLVRNLSGGEIWLNVMIEDANGIQRRKQLKMTLVEGQQRVENITFDGNNAVMGEVKNLPPGNLAQLVLLRGKEAVNFSDPKQEKLLDERTVLSKSVKESGTFRLDGVEAGDYTLIAVLTAVKSNPTSGADEILNTVSRPVKIEEGKTASIVFEF